MMDFLRLSDTRRVFIILMVCVLALLERRRFALSCNIMYISQSDSELFALSVCVCDVERLVLD